MKMRPLVFFFWVFFAMFFLAGCNGTRNIYSAVPFESPAPMKSGQNSIEFTYSSNKSKPNSDYADTVGNKNKGYGLHFGHMINAKIKILAYTDFKKEKNTILFHIPNGFRTNNIFDSSVIYTNRITAGMGFQVFTNPMSKRIMSFSGILGFQSLKLKESGLDTSGAKYSRYFNMTQLLLTNQFSILFKLSKQFSIAYMSRLSFGYYLPSTTDYNAYEKFTAGLNKDNGIGAYLCLIGLYAEVQPIKSFPFIISGQWYNDWTIYQKLFSKYEPARKNIKGNGGSLGVKYIF